MKKTFRTARLLLPLLITIASLLALGVSVYDLPKPSTQPHASEQLAAATLVVPPPTVSPALSVPAPAPPDSNLLIFSASREGREELYSASFNAHSKSDVEWKQLTRGYSPARAPALSPDGKRLAFQSRKDGNWEIYVLQLDSGSVTRLTNDLAYDGAPSWSPDGKTIAFESYHDGDLDIWKMNDDGSMALNLTPNEPAYDYGPAWSPDGKWIAYTSWSTGSKQMFIMNPDGTGVKNISANEFQDEQPAWSPDGHRLAFVSNREGCNPLLQVGEPPAPGSVQAGNCQRRDIFLADFSNSQLSGIKQLTFSGRENAPTWSGDGTTVAFVSPRPTRQPLYSIPVTGGFPQPLGDYQMWINSVTWSALDDIGVGFKPETYPPLAVEQPIAAPAEEGHPYEMRMMKEIYLAPSYGEMSSAVASSLLALRTRTKQETGIDFLSSLSDMTRSLDTVCDSTCDSLSWHKAGRAVDTQLALLAGGTNSLEIKREDEFGETYWRLYVRAARQDGSMGEPLKDAPWDFSYNSRYKITPWQGGIEASLPHGYYVDFTELARAYGWQRISSHDDPDFDWRTNKLGSEYWHYQKTDGLEWYNAMSQLYAPDDLSPKFDWDLLVRKLGIQPMRLYLKQIPPPPSAWKWYALLPLDGKE